VEVNRYHRKPEEKNKQTRMNQITYTQGLYETINTTTIRIIIMNMRVRKS
jgi:hypothetical protein